MQNIAVLLKPKMVLIPKVDLIFLDIEMPVLNGFELLDVLNNKPQIIFVTGKTEYAFKAFNYDATDYLQNLLLENALILL